MNTNGNEKTTIEAEYCESKLPARLLPVSEVAHFLGVHPSTVRRWEKRGLLKSYTIGLRHNLRFKQEDVLNFLYESKDGMQAEYREMAAYIDGKHEIEVERRSV